MTVPVANVYYLLCYAWDCLDVGGPARVASEPFAGPADLFARVLEHGVARLLKRGPDRGYVEVAADARTPRGKLDLAATVKRNLAAVPAVACVADDLRHDLPHNQILKATLARLGRCPDVARPLRDRCAALARRFADVTDTPLSPALFARVRLHRNNRHYRLLVNVCRVLLDGLLPDPRGGPFAFADFTRDERAMAEVFEAFVRNFYRREQTAFPRVGIERFDWQHASGDPAALALLPEMRTDVCLTSPGRKLVIDAKYYAAALTAYYDARSLHAAHLYQLFAYLSNLAARAKPGQRLEGMLLYPTVDRELDLRYVLHGHPVRVATVDLNRPWVDIRMRMLELIG
jgi:5-methylcytosine-specific restriction enzyme subunit McrC